jgi:Fe-S oxidoreductase
MNEEIKKSFRKTKAYYCQECGKCSSACPVTLKHNEFTPRLLVKKALLGFENDLLEDKYIWECLTCNLCNDVCMSDVLLPEFIRAIRKEAQMVDNKGVPSHCEVPFAFERLTASPNLKQDRMDWISKDLKISKDTGDTLLWVGCAPYHKILFSEFDDSTDVPQAAIRILNHLRETPVVLPNEKCCGHDMYWLGNEEIFSQLMEQNKKAIKSTGVKRIITACAECYYTLKNLYDLDIPVQHITEYLAENIEKNNIEFKKLKPETVTYHDPCRLGRFSDQYDAPRKVLAKIPGLEFKEMERSKHRSPCCGVSAWMNCNDLSKDMRVDKLNSAKSLSADKLITACPKCRIHLRCYTSNQNVEPQIDIEVEDITLLAAKAMGLDKKRRTNK